MSRTGGSEYDVGPPRDAGEVERFAAIAEESLAFERRQRNGSWLERYEVERFRLVRRGGAVVGGLYLIEAGQFHGGARVPMVGVNAVAIAPEARGSGVGTALMHAAMRELHGDRAPIAVLYPATQPIYRRAGFEQAGDFQRLRVATADLPRGTRELAIERFDPADGAARAEVVALGRAVSAREPGGLDRDDFLWQRLFSPLAYRPTLLRVREEGRVTGFVSLQQIARPPGPGLHTLHLHVRATMATTPAALSRICTAIADHDSICEAALFDGPPRHPLLALLPECRPQVDVATRWMLRVTHAPTALAARGYPRGLRAALVLDLDDELLPHRGRWLLEVAGGEGRATPAPADHGDAPTIAIRERGLASLYASYFTAEELARLGLCAGDADALATASAIFAGPAPWLGEIF